MFNQIENRRINRTDLLDGMYQGLYHVLIASGKFDEAIKTLHNIKDKTTRLNLSQQVLAI